MKSVVFTVLGVLNASVVWKYFKNNILWRKNVAIVRQTVAGFFFGHRNQNTLTQIHCSLCKELRCVLL